MPPEITKQTWFDTKKQEQSEVLSLEQQNQLQKEKEQVLMISKAQRGSLSNETIVSYLSKYHNVDISRYSPEIKQKFIEEIQMIFSEFKDFDESMIIRLREIRENMSMWQEEWKSNEYYRNMILWNKINTRITLIEEAIKTQEWKTIEIKWKQIHKENYETLQKWMESLDSKNGIKVFENIFSKLRPSMGWWLNFNAINVKQIYQTECKKNNQTYNEEIYKEYEKLFMECKNKNIIFEWRNGNWIINYKWKWFWFSNGWTTWVDYSLLEKTYSEKLWDVEKMWMADLVIMMRVLFWIIPVFWDMVWWKDDLKQANGWVNFDGSIQWMPENMMWYFTWVLQLSMIWWGFAKISKWPRYIKVIAKLWEVIAKLSKSTWLVELGKNPKIMWMLEMMKWVIPKVWELLEKIKSWVTKWVEKVKEKVVEKIMPNTTAVFKKDEKYLSKIQPETILLNREIYKDAEQKTNIICKKLKIPKNSQRYNSISSDVTLFLKTILDKDLIENFLLTYTEILKIHPDFSLWVKGIEYFSTISVQKYLDLIGNPQFKNLIINTDSSVIFRIIDDFTFSLPENENELKILINIYKKYPGNLSNRFKLLRIEDSFDDLSLSDKYKLLENLLQKNIDSKLLDRLYNDYYHWNIWYVADNWFYDLLKIICDETKSKEDIEKAINTFYKNLEEIEKIRELENVQIVATSPWDFVGEFINDSNSLFDRFWELLKFPEKFNPKKWLEYIKKLPPLEKQKAMEIWKKMLKDQLDIMATIPTETKNIAEKFDYVNGKQEDIISLIIQEFTPKLKELSIEQRKKIISWIEEYINKKFMVHKYAEMPQYKNNPKQLIADAYWIDVSKLKWEFSVEIDGANFTFYTHNEDDYRLLFACWNEEKAKIIPSSWWFASSWAKNKELAWTISSVNGSNDGKLYKIEVKIHETKHMENQIVMPDHWKWDNLSRAKDEILAYLTDWSSIEKIKNTLFYKWDEALYDYYETMKQNNPEKYKKIRALYENELNTAINIAKKMKEANIPNYIDILAITPVRQWWNLEKIYLNKNLTESQKVFENMKMIFEKTSEVYFAIKNDSENLLWYFSWNLLFFGSQVIPIEIIFIWYLDEKYPNRKSELANSINWMSSKIKSLFNKENIEKYLDEFYFKKKA